MKKILAGSLAAVFFLVGFFCWSGAPTANATVATNESADIVVGQTNFTGHSANKGDGPAVDASKLYYPRCPFFDGEKFFVVDRGNNRVLIYNSMPSSSNASADLVIGQASLSSGGLANQGGAVGANTLNQPSTVFSDGSRLFITDSENNRVLIFNSIPEANNASADIVIGQPDMTSNAEDQSGAAAANTLDSPSGFYFTGKQIIVSDWDNNRVLIFNSVPTANNASADIVMGQSDFSGTSADAGGSVAANTMEKPNGIFFNGKKLFVADQYNHRILIFNSFPTANNASADTIIGQTSATVGSSNQGAASAAANTLNYPTGVFAYGTKLLIVDGGNNRVLVFNSIPVASNASADVAVGQQNMTSGSINQTGNATGAEVNTLFGPRGVFVAEQKLIIGDYNNNRVLIYNSFGSQWTIAKNHSQTLSGDEKIKVKKKKLEFSGKKTAWKKGRVRVYRDGNLVKNVKIKNSGKWKAKFKDTGSAVKEFVIKYYDRNGTLQLISETYILGINRGSLVEATLEKATFDGSAGEKPTKANTGQSSWEFPEADIISQ